MVSRESYIIELEQENAILTALVEDLTERITTLEKALKLKSIKKDSQNSSIPPSMDFKGKNQSLRNKSDNPVGGQPGHEGHTLLMKDNADIVVLLQPDYCKHCGNDLREVKGIEVGKRQVVDIPQIAAQYTEYRQYAKQCPCCHCQQKSVDISHHSLPLISEQTLPDISDQSLPVDEV